MNKLNIIARKPRPYGGEYIVVDRGKAHAGPGRFVSACANEQSLSAGEWYWGHYFPTESAALEDFNARPKRANQDGVAK